LQHGYILRKNILIRITADAKEAIMAVNGIPAGQQANTLDYGIEQKKNNELFKPVEIEVGKKDRSENENSDKVTLSSKSKEAAGALSQNGQGARPEKPSGEAGNVETQQALQAYRNAENTGNNKEPEKMRERQISMMVR
jgi:hypothetical protein